MSKVKGNINLLFYIIALVAAIYVVYFAFSEGFRKGKFEGKYYPPTEQQRPEEDVKQVNLRKLLEPTDSLVAEGRRLYKLNCASCHGEDGRGQGPKSAGLNPPPRNFLKEKFKHGASIVEIYNTITNGVQGTSMPAFDLLPGEERMAMAQYVATMVPELPESPPELVAQLPGGDGEEVASEAVQDTTADTTQAPRIEPIPVDVAMEMIFSRKALPRVNQAEIETDRLYIRHCSSCHGNKGQGTVSAEQVVPSSVIYLHKGRFYGRESEVLKNRREFRRFLVESTPGLREHRFGFLSGGEIDELYDYVRTLSEISR